MLTLRRGPVERIFSAPAGSIFEEIINLVNRAEPTPLIVGDIFRNGKAMQETINPTPLLTDLLRIKNRSGEDYAWRPVVGIDGLLTIYADWYERLGVDTDALLHEGHGGGNLESKDRIMIEDGDIFNDILGYSDGITWTGRPMANVIDAESIGKYGLRQTSINWSGVSTVATTVNPFYFIICRRTLIY